MSAGWYLVAESAGSTTCEEERRRAVGCGGDRHGREPRRRTPGPQCGADSDSDSDGDSDGDGVRGVLGVLGVLGVPRR